MVRETRAYFREMLDKDLNSSYLVKSNFAMLNEKLAVHYGIPGVSGSQIRRVELPADCPRGAFLTQASILKITANGTTTSPVPRGAFVLDRLLGQPPDPPPPNIPRDRARRARRQDDPRAAGQAPHQRSLRLVPREDGSAGLRARIVRRHWRFPHALPFHWRWRPSRRAARSTHSSGSVSNWDRKSMRAANCPMAHFWRHGGIAEIACRGPK